MRALYIRKLTIIIILFGFINLQIWAQKNNNLVAKLDYEKTDQSNIVRGWIQHNQVLPAVFKYVFSVEKGDTTLTNRNSFRAEPGQKIPLSKATFFFRNDDDIKKIKLEVFRYGKLVAADSIIIQIPKTQVTSEEKSPQTLSSPRNSIHDIEIDGLILDETRSKMGHDFYEHFYNNWAAPNSAKGFIITIRELPARGRAAQISVEVNDQTLIRRFLQPRAELIENLANQSVSVVKNHLEKMEDLKSQKLTEDLSGSGIY